MEFIRKYVCGLHGIRNESDERLTEINPHILFYISVNYAKREYEK